MINLTTILNSLGIMLLALTIMNVTDTIGSNNNTFENQISILQDRVNRLEYEAMKNKKVVYYEVDGKKGTLIMPADATDLDIALKIKEMN